MEEVVSDVVILVGRRADGGHRDRLWAYCEEFWVRETGWPIFVGHYDEPGPFCLSVASNRAAAAAGDWEVALYVGADVVLGSGDQARAAVGEAAGAGHLVFAHDHYYSLSEAGMEDVLAGSSPHGRLSEWPAWSNTFSSALAVPRQLWDEVGGFDERFRGWGFEDLAFWSACCALTGSFDRVTGPVFHLYHERDPKTREASLEHAENEALGRRYLAAKGSRRKMKAILAERR
jgi:hypothetical protein